MMVRSIPRASESNSKHTRPNESMVSLVLRQYMRGENGTESLVGRSAMALRSVLLIQIGKQNVKIIEK